MVIDSRFNLVGINFAHVVESDDPQNKGNQIVLFKGEYQIWQKWIFWWYKKWFYR
ncbi:hypothetical protein NW062_03225 [Mycoplasmopsis cynos]|nr:hypothetical protein NW062_03225 [Mycoplasmopsis cynos]